MNGNQTLFVVVAVLLCACEVEASVGIIEDFQLDWVKADGDKLVMGGNSEEKAYRDLICVTDGDGEVIVI